MSERKVLSKYYPPDFDPNKISRPNKSSIGRRPQKIRLMSPFPMKCLKCGLYIRKGKKFNANKEVPPNEKYLQIQIYRFYIRCPDCKSEIAFRTDPQNLDYICERGATRSIESWRSATSQTDTQQPYRSESEEQERNLTPIQTLEEKARDTQQEIAVADALDNIRVNNAAREKIAVQARLKTIQRQQEEQDRLDTREAQQVFQNQLSESNRVSNEERLSVPSFRRSVRKNRETTSKLGIKRKGTQ